MQALDAAQGSPSEEALQRVRARAALEQPGWLYYAAWALALGTLAWAWRGAEIRPLDLIRDSANIGTYTRDFFPPDFSDWRIYVREMIITLHIAVWGTLLAVIAPCPSGCWRRPTSRRHGFISRYAG